MTSSKPGLLWASVSFLDSARLAESSASLARTCLGITKALAQRGHCLGMSGWGLGPAFLLGAQVVLGVCTWSPHPLAHLGFSSSSMNSRLNHSLSRKIFAIPPTPQHAGQHGALPVRRLRHLNVALETQMGA